MDTAKEFKAWKDEVLADPNEILVSVGHYNNVKTYAELTEFQQERFITAWWNTGKQPQLIPPQEYPPDA